MTVDELRAKLTLISDHLWWKSSDDIDRIFYAIDRDLWEDANHSMVRFLKHVSPEAMEKAVQDVHIYGPVDQAVREVANYGKNPVTWASLNSAPLQSRAAVYFSMEFGIHEGFPNYSGGLGILAGDHLKSCSDLGLPLVGVSLLYREGYFSQSIDRDGRQHESYTHLTVDDLPISRCHTREGHPLTVAVQTRQGEIVADVYQTHVGRATLLLLDIERDQPSDIGRDVSTRLYAGDNRNRIAQELVLGVGGLRAVRALGYTVGAIHMNEGHSAFAVLEDARYRMKHAGISRPEALAQTAALSVFTTHTPVLAGHDRFDADLTETIIGPLRDELGLTHDQLLGLGRIDIFNPHETFCMTVLAMRMSTHINAVSSIHGSVTRSNWQALWPAESPNEVPVGHITNGVHVHSWLSKEMARMYRYYLGQNWPTRLSRKELWAAVREIPAEEIWEVRNAVRSRLMKFVERRVQRQEAIANTQGMQPVHLSHETLTIGFARRFAPYKRGNMFMSDMERILRLIHDSHRPIQFVIAGKAHPQDEPGKEILKQVINFARSHEAGGKVVFVEDYDINVTRAMIQGVDVWLNNPRPPLEASGTSGMKAMFNGVLNFSILDGWWPEAYDGHNGFAIGTLDIFGKVEDQDAADAASFYDVLENQIIPEYYDRPDGIPTRWIERIKRAWWTMGWRFNSDRMVMDYVNNGYNRAAGVLTADRRTPRRTREWQRLS